MINELKNLINEGILSDMVNEINAWDASLDYLNYMYMDDFNELMGHLEPMELANKIYFGDFNPCDDYFNFNSHGNLISYSQWDIEYELKDNEDEIIKRFIELYEEGHVSIWHEEITDILDKILNHEEE